MGLGAGFFLAGFLGAGSINQEVQLPAALPTINLISLLISVVGAAFVVSNLSKPSRMHYAMRNLRQSWISRGALMFALFAILSFFLTVSGLMHMPQLFATILQITTIIPAFVLLFYPAMAMHDSKGVPLWNSMFVPAAAGVYSLSSGFGLVIILSPRLTAGIVGTAVVLFSSLGVACTLMTLGAKYREGGIAKDSVLLLVRGEQRALFVVGVIVIGWMLPLVLLGVSLLIGAGGGLAILSVLAGALLIAGSFLSRYSFLKAGLLASPMLTQGPR